VNWRRILCIIGFHDMRSWAEDHGYAAPPLHHHCHPRLPDTPEMMVQRFKEWTRLRCRHCSRTYPPDREPKEKTA
jgi:hypothetical protein